MPTSYEELHTNESGSQTDPDAQNFPDLYYTALTAADIALDREDLLDNVLKTQIGFDFAVVAIYQILLDDDNFLGKVVEGFVKGLFSIAAVAAAMSTVA